jgi:hypothetical protein
MNLQTVFGILVILYTVSNLASMGLELTLRETIKSLRSARQVELYAPIAPLAFYVIFGLAVSPKKRIVAPAIATISPRRLTSLHRSELSSPEHSR